MGDLLLWLRRKPAKQMEAIERVPLSAQHALHLVRVKEKLMLVVTGPGSSVVKEVE
jgi:flagellar biogenesis protein FliO